MIETVAEAFLETAARSADRPAFHVTASTAAAYGIAPGEITYGEAITRVMQLRANFRVAGYGMGHRAALLLENRPAFFLNWLALNGLGVSVVPLNPDLRAADLAYVIGHAEPDLIVAAPERHGDLAEAADRANISPAIVAEGEAPPRLDDAANEILPTRATEAAILYTSGTTGAPKGCVLSNDYFLSAGEWYAAAGGLCALTDDGERMLTPLPTFHMNAMAYSFMAMVQVGGCLIALDRLHPTTWWEDVAGSGATSLHYLGVMPTMLMAAAPSPADRAHKVRFGFGAGVDPKLHAPFEDRFGFPLVEAWAMTETGAGAVIAANDASRPVGRSCLGRPAPTVDARIGEEGELLVRAAGPDPRKGFFSHYHKDPQATDDAWAGGWFHTGDIVARDDAGYVYFTDRLKNVIRRSGENIAAVEVESTLLRHPSVTAAAVTAVPDEIRGDEVFACIVADAPSADLAEAIVRFALAELAYFKAPAYIAFVDALPVTATQKVQRGELKALAKRLLDDPATHCLGHLKKRASA